MGTENLPLVGTLQHHYHQLPGATLLPSSALQGVVSALWLLATWDGLVGPCLLTLTDIGRRFKLWKTVVCFAEVNKASQKNRYSPLPTCELLLLKKKEEFVITEQDYR